MAHENLIGILDDVVSHGMEEKNGGNVESPVGYFALIGIERESVEDLMTDLYDNDWTAGYITAPEPGWYVFRQDSDGNKTFEGPDSEDEARAWYGDLVEAYDEWRDIEN